MSLKTDPKSSKVYLTGTGLGSLSAAIYLIQDAHYEPSNIYIYEENGEDLYGGCCDAETDKNGKIHFMRGSRMFEEKFYRCTKHFWGRIPLVNEPNKTVLDEHNEHWKEYKIDTVVRLMGENASRESGYDLGLSFADKMNFLKLSMTPERKLGTKSIREVFTEDFFKSNFWYMWRTTFAFHSWHSAVEMKRYMHLFSHQLPAIHSMSGVQRTKNTGFTSFIDPAIQYLKKQGVNIYPNTKVVDFDLEVTKKKRRITKLYIESEILGNKVIDVSSKDRVFLTMGSMVADHTYGTNDTPVPYPTTNTPDTVHQSWKLWEKASRKASDFGRPEVFTRDHTESRFLGFTTTFHNDTFRKLFEGIVERKMGKTGQLTLYTSPWFITFCNYRQPMFPNQKSDTSVAWGYGLHNENLGRFVKKPMHECSGREILEEVLGFLGIEKEKEEILDNSTTIPYYLPYGISQFLRRTNKDRPKVVPDRSENFAFLGQYTEIPKHSVFTTEYSIRSAMIACKKLVDPSFKIPKMYFSLRHPVVIIKVIKTLYRKEK